MTIQSKTYDKSSGRTHSDVVAGYDVPFSALDLSLSFDTMETQSKIENLEGEIWKDIPNYEGLYKVSNLGRFISLKREVVGHNGGKYEIKDRIFYGNLNKHNGYLYIHLSQNGKGHGFRAHKIVALVFIPNPNNYPIINHKDENKQNNRADNLEWCDSRYNANYGNARKKLSASLVKSKGVKVIQKDKSGKIIAKYNSIQEAERATGVQHQLIGKVVNKKYDKEWNGKYYKRTTAGGFIWELA